MDMESLYMTVCKRSRTYVVGLDVMPPLAEGVFSRRDDLHRDSRWCSDSRGRRRGGGCRLAGRCGRGGAVVAHLEALVRRYERVRVIPEGYSMFTRGEAGWLWMTARRSVGAAGSGDMRLVIWSDSRANIFSMMVRRVSTRVT